MKNTMSLENYGVVEMTTREMKATNGGNPVALVVGIVALGIAILNTDWDKAAEDFKRGWNDAAKT